MFVLLLQISFAIINTTGIFPVEESVTGFDEKKISEMIDQLDEKSDEMESVLDYFTILGTILSLGVRIIVSLVVSLFSAVPTILRLFFIPDVIAKSLGYAVNVLVLLGLSNM
ncbi:MAG: hypothetical protein KAW93_06430, partial [Methanogenium sp.]|nr:hypothetical protein [Methanogenium sp.]